MDLHKDKGSGFKILRGYAYEQCCQLIIGLAMLVGGALAQFVVPGLIGVVLDAMGKGDWESINYYCVLMIIVVFVSAVCAAIRASTFNTISEKIAQQLRYRPVLFRDK